MKITVIIMTILGLVLTGAAQLETCVRVKVLKNNCNLRAKALATAEIVGQVSENDVLLARTIGEDWVEVVAPTNAEVWVLGDYVKEGLINCRQKVNVRAGPGINFSVVGQLADGQAVERRGSHADWIKIAPPAVCSVWIARSLVEEIPATELQPAKLDVAKIHDGEPALPPTAESGTPKQETRIAAPAPTAAFVPPGLTLDPLKEQGRLRQVEGVLRRKNFLMRAPSDFRLVSYDESGKESETIYFIKGNQEQLKALLHRHLVISGREYWVQRQKYPVIVPDHIVLK
ncbi:MAG: SH3 domain-containing protein [Lentisphaerae bacterium]|nr:SH3 domain-containing protein [Lentisphaerota bacterium]